MLSIHFALGISDLKANISLGYGAICHIFIYTIVLLYIIKENGSVREVVLTLLIRDSRITKFHYTQISRLINLLHYVN